MIESESNLNLFLNATSELEIVKSNLDFSKSNDIE
jgi:hypothetical protein